MRVRERPALRAAVGLRRRQGWLVGTIGFVAAGCAGSTVHFEVKQASDFKGGRATVSVLGVMQDGIMSPEAWKAIGPLISQAFHQSACEIFYGERLERERPDLFAAVGKSARDEGTASEWVASVSARAQGELVMVVEMHAHASGGVGIAERERGVLIAHGGGAGDPRFLPRGAAAEASELSAKLFSARRSEIVARVSMRYAGIGQDVAFAQFSGRLASELPDAVCVAWRWDAPPPADHPAAGAAMTVRAERSPRRRQGQARSRATASMALRP